MFQNTSRVQTNDGIVFYEQDVIIDDFIYNTDSEINLTIDYLNSGFGLLLINQDDVLREKNEMYLFRLGYKEYSIEYKIETLQRTILRSPINVAPPKINTNFKLTKTGRKIIVTSDIASFEYVMPKNFEKYKIGIYSNSNNVVKTINSSTKVPSGWVINMKNTGGGHVRFEDNCFILNECHNGCAEIIQNSIKIESGLYKLNLISETIDGENDIVPYVYYEDDERIIDDEKNLLEDDNSFYIKRDCKICLKFKGKKGVIKNIFITDNEEDSYTPTKTTEQIIDGSYMKIKTGDFKLIKWTGTIKSIPNKTYSIIDDGIQRINAYDLGVFTNTKYEYEYDTKKNMLYVYKDDEILKSTIINSGCEELKIFYNVDAEIDDFYLIKHNGEKINVIVSTSNKKYVPGNITSPIVVADYSDMPFDLSSSYRIIKNKDKENYVFTNIEREFFKPSPHIKLSNKVVDRVGSIKIYGILDNPKIDYKKMLTIPSREMDTINLFSSKYDILYESNLKSFNKQSGDIYLYDYDKYNLIIIDYLKDDSYCINYDYALKSYEIDISTSKKNYYILYDYVNRNDGSKNYSSINRYKNTGIMPEEDSYIVLRRNDLI